MGFNSGFKGLRMTPNTVYDISVVFYIVIILYILHILYIYMFMTYSTSHTYFGKLLDPWNVCMYVFLHVYVGLTGRKVWNEDTLVDSNKYICSV